MGDALWKGQIPGRTANVKEWEEHTWQGESETSWEEWQEMRPAQLWGSTGSVRQGPLRPSAFSQLGNH